MTAGSIDRPYGDLDAALQSAMLEVDEEYGQQWLDSMRKLVEAKLSHKDFTFQRMNALHDWERRRKAAQARLRWKYAAGKRPDRLVERDVNAQLAKTRAKLASLDQLMAAQKAGIDPGDEAIDVAADIYSSFSALKEALPDRKPTRKPKPVRSLEGRTEFELQMVIECSGMDDLEHATDADLLRACMKHSHIDRTAAQQYVNILNGTFQR